MTIRFTRAHNGIIIATHPTTGVTWTFRRYVNFAIWCLGFIGR